MRKQEEFGLAQSAGLGEAWNNDRQIPAGFTLPLQINTAAVSASEPHTSESSAGTTQASTSSADTSASRDGAQEASWASLQRALNAAQQARPQFHASGHDQEQPCASLPFREAPPSALASQEHLHTGPSSISDWSSQTSSSGPWTMSTHPSDNTEFDFDFGTHPLTTQSTEEESAHSATDSPTINSGLVVNDNSWASAMPTPTGSYQAPAPETVSMGSEPLDIPRYPVARKDSSDELSATLGHFGIAGTPPLASPSEGLHIQRTESHIGIAARRKVPRPAAIGTAALRSSSYGGHSAMSPTFRFNRQPPSPHSIRHVKSTGQNLNVKYAGIRKISAPQKSPLNIATFAEAEEFNDLMAKQQASRHMSNQSASPPTPHSNEDVRGRLLKVEEPFFRVGEDVVPTHGFTETSQFRLSSPPSTPMKQEHFVQSQMSSMMPPLSAPPQYAVFPDYTPPYSAGPLTTSSWSDAPVASPEVASFSPTVHMPQPHSYTPTPLHEFIHSDSFPLQQTSPSQSQSPVDQKPLDLTPPAGKGAKQTEFFIQEFPRQKEEHAHAAQQMPPQKPRNFVFSNATQNDF